MQEEQRFLPSAFLKAQVRGTQKTSQVASVLMAILAEQNPLRREALGVHSTGTGISQT